MIESGELAVPEDLPGVADRRSFLMSLDATAFQIAKGRNGISEEKAQDFVSNKKAAEQVRRIQNDDNYLRSVCKGIRNNGYFRDASLPVLFATTDKVSGFVAADLQEESSCILWTMKKASIDRDLIPLDDLSKVKHLFVNIDDSPKAQFLIFRDNVNEKGIRSLAVGSELKRILKTYIRGRLVHMPTIFGELKYSAIAIKKALVGQDDLQEAINELKHELEHAAQYFEGLDAMTDYLLLFIIRKEPRYITDAAVARVQISSKILNEIKPAMLSAELMMKLKIPGKADKECARVLFCIARLNEMLRDLERFGETKYSSLVRSLLNVVLSDDDVKAYNIKVDESFGKDSTQAAKFRLDKNKG